MEHNSEQPSFDPNPANQPAAPLYGGGQAAPAAGRAINGLVLNILIPGVGSLVAGRITGLFMLLLLLGGFVSFFILPSWFKFAGILPIVAAWIWSIIAGIQLLSQKQT